MAARDIQGHVAMITGAGSGIGAGIALRLAEAGCSVFLIGRTLKKLEKTQSLILDKFPDAKIHLAAIDIRKAEELEQAVKECVQQFNAIDIVVNSAGIGALTSSSIDLWDDTIDTNLKAAMRLSGLALPHLKSSVVAKRTAAIINISSVSGKNHFGNLAPYCASKHGLDGFSQSLFNAVKDHGIRVTCISPGWVDTPMIEDLAIDSKRCLSTEQVATTVHFVITFPGHGCITDLTIMPQHE